MLLVHNKQKLLHGDFEITPPIRQGILMSKRTASTSRNLLLRVSADITPRTSQSVQRFPLFRARLSVEEITFVELKYNNIPIGDTRPGKLLRRKWAHLSR